jgi:WD40 repeat protein
MADVFISYSRKDEVFVRQLHEGLAQQNRDVWVDWQSIPPTSEWMKEIFASIEAADNFLFVVSPDSCASEMCREEVAYAEANHKRLIPIVCRAVSNNDLPPALSRIQWIVFGDGKFEPAFSSLLQALDTDLDWVRSHTRLLVRAREWDVKGRDTAFLLRGMDLQHAVQWLAQNSIKEPKAAALQEEYIRASQKSEAEEVQRLTDSNEQKRRRAKRFRQLSIALGATLILVIGVAFFALRQRAQAESRQFAAQAQQSFALGDSSAALREGIEAVERWPTDEAELALRTVVEGPLVQSILHDSGPVDRAAYSLDGKHILSTSRVGAAVWNAQAGNSLAILNAHAGSVNAAAFSPDGKRVVTASTDNTARVWDAESGLLLVSLAGHTCVASQSGPGCAVNSAVFSPDGTRIVTGGDDHTARIWDAATGHPIATLVGHEDAVLDAEFSPDGKRIVTASTDSTGRVWDAETGRPLAVLITGSGLRYLVNSAEFSSDGKLIVTANADGARIWNAGTGHLLSTLPGTSALMGAAFSSDGKRVASGGGTGRVWEAATGHLLTTLDSPGMVFAPSFSSDGKLIAAPTQGNTARVWDSHSGRLVSTLAGHNASVEMAAFSPDGNLVVTASLDGTARVWLAESGKLLAILTGHTDSLNTASFSPDGRDIVTASKDGVARVWNSQVVQPQAGFTGEIAAYSADGRLILIAGAKDSGRVWDVQSRRQVADLGGDSKLIAHAAFFADGKRILTNNTDNTARVWDAQNGSLLATLKGTRSLVKIASSSPDGTRVAIVSFSDSEGGRGVSVEVWDVASGKQVASIRPPSHSGTCFTCTASDADIYDLEFSPDGKQFVTALDDGTAQVWDATTGHSLAILKGHKQLLTAAVFSPDGKRIVTASNDDTAREWDAKSGTPLFVLTGHTGHVTSAKFSPDGKRILTASEDHTVRVWDADTGQRLGFLTGPTDAVVDAAFSPDGKQVVACSQDGTLRIYIADLDDVLNLAKAHLPNKSSN